MYSTGQMVRYGAHGICHIVDIVLKRIMNQEMRYYVLKPIYQESSTIYVPVDNQNLTSRMQRLLGKEEIMQIIGGMSGNESLWIDNDTERRDTYNEILRNGDRSAMARIIKTLYLRQKELSAQRKKLHIADEKILKETERVLYEEFAYVLGMEQDKVLPFIQETIRNEEQLPAAISS